MKPLRSYEDVKETAKARRETKDAMRQPMKKVNKERGGQRVTEGRDPDYLDWIRKQPSVITGYRTGEWVRTTGGVLMFNRPVLIVAMHMKHGRTSGTDSTALPGEDFYHDEMHNIGIKTWAKKYNLDLPALIAAHRKRHALECAEKVKHESRATT